MNTLKRRTIIRIFDLIRLILIVKKLILKKHDRFTQIVEDEEVNTNKDP